MIPYLLFTLYRYGILLVLRYCRFYVFRYLGHGQDKTVKSPIKVNWTKKVCEIRICIIITIIITHSMCTIHNILYCNCIQLQYACDVGVAYIVRRRIYTLSYYILYICVEIINNVPRSTTIIGSRLYNLNGIINVHRLYTLPCDNTIERVALAQIYRRHLYLIYFIPTIRLLL